VGDELGDAKQVVGGADHVSSELRSLSPSVSTSPQTSDGLDPSEDLLDALADPLADLIASVAYGATIAGGPTVFALRDVRCDVGVAAVADEISAVVAAIGCDGNPTTPLTLPEHFDGCLSLAAPCGLAHA